MLHLDLFSGIGGFALAADRVWGDVEHIFCDNDPFCQAVLKKHWPNSEIYGDIRTLTNTRSKKQRGLSDSKRQEISEVGEVYLLTGGFPCQPFSQAGRRKGTTDDRYLWPEMLRVIREFKPQWVIGENVAGLLSIEQGVVFEQVCLDLEAEGYEVQPFVIPAVSVNAPHRRDRVWIVAHSTSERRNDRSNHREERYFLSDKGASEESESKRKGRECGSGEVGSKQQYEQGDSKGVEADKTKWSSRKLSSERSDKNDSDAQCKRHKGSQSETRQNARFSRGELSSQWNKNWIEVATQLCRVDDGLPKRMDRNQRLKALGNAIVPQVAEQIMLGIKSNLYEKIRKL